MNLSLMFCLIIGCCAQNFTDFNKRVNYFAIELMYFTHKEIDNTLLSPFGVWCVLTGISSGATSLSRARLIEVLRLPNDVRARDGYRHLTQAVLNNNIRSKNNLYYHMNITLPKEFEHNLTDHFDIVPVKLDFKESHTAALVANTIISDTGIKTHDLVVGADFIHSNVILTSVMKFRGLLESSFSKERTSTQPFYMSPSESFQLNMMQQTGNFSYANIHEIKSEVIEMPYINNNISMLVILPNENVTLDELYEGFTRISIEDVLGKLKKQIVSISMPRFKISSNLILNEPLSQMGLDIFTRYASFIGTSDFFISKLVHKVDFQFIETGNDRMQLVPDKMFVADRPFVYLILERTTKTCVIGGVFTKPKLY